MLSIQQKNEHKNPNTISSVKVRLKEENHRTSFSKNETFKMIQMISGRLVR
jgi:hypothetical protein